MDRIGWNALVDDWISWIGWNALVDDWISWIGWNALVDDWISWIGWNALVDDWISLMTGLVGLVGSYNTSLSRSMYGDFLICCLTCCLT